VKSLSKLIAADDSFKAWALPEIGANIDSGHQSHKKSGPPLDPQKELEQELARLKEQARRDGLQQGLAEGRAKATEERRVYSARFEALMQALATPLEQLSDEVEDELVKLAVAIAKQIVRRELKSEPAQVVGVVKEALNALPAAGQNIRLQLHPDDARLVAEIMLANVTERKWELVENPIMQRGGCRIETDTASVDATIESRVAAIAARIMGGERSNDN
jgi:flagellar assembly protein FliH